MLHSIFPNRCLPHIVVNTDWTITCSKCGKYIGTALTERIYLTYGYQKFRRKIESLFQNKKYPKFRNQVDEEIDAEWRDFLRNLRFSEDEIYPVETTGGWLSEDSEWDDASGC